MFQFTFANRTEESGMAVVWIAGTVASGTHAHAAGALRRLSKKDVARVDVRKVCAYIVAPPAPLALRLSSNLMFGASRVLANQMAFLHSDANSVFVRLKKVFSEASTGASITMMATEASAAAITLHIGDENDILSDEAFVDRQLGKERQLGWFIADSNILRNNHSIEERSSSGRASLPVGHGGNDRDSLTMSLLSQPHNPNRSLNAVISIPSVSAVGAGHSNHSLGLVSRRIGIPGSASHSNRSIDFGMGGIGEIDGGGGGEFSGSSGDGSGGLFDYFAGDDDFQAIDNGNLDGFMGEERLNTSFLGNDAGGNEAQGKNVDSIDDQAFNFFEEDAVPDFPITEPIESRKRALEFEGDDNGDFYFNGVDDGTSFGDLRRTSGGSKGTKASTVGSTIVGSKKPKPRKRAKKNFIDAKTELESKDMGVVSRNRQSVVLSLLELEKSQKAFEKKMKELVHNSFNRFSFTRGPLLENLFKRNRDFVKPSTFVSMPLKSEKRAYKKRKTVVPDAAIDDPEILQNYQNDEEFGQGYNDFEGDAIPEHLLLDNDNSNNTRSNESRQNNNNDDEDIEIGVARSGEDNSTRSGDVAKSRLSMPWAVRSQSQSQVHSRAPSIGSARISVLGSDGHLSLLDEEVRKGGIGSARSSSGGIGGSFNAEWSAGDEGSNDVLLLDSIGSSVLIRDTAETINGGEESHSFLQYAKSHARKDGSNFVYLNGLVSNLKSRAASSQSFYHVLYLLTQNEISVEQSVPFSDIKIVFHDDGDDDLQSSDGSKSLNLEEDPEQDEQDQEDEESTD